MQYDILFLQTSNFQLEPFINSDTNQNFPGLIILILIIGSLFTIVPIILGQLRKKLKGVKEVPPFNKDNFFTFASRSGLPRDITQYLFQHVRSHTNHNPMLIFFNYTNMLQIFKGIYQQEKLWKKGDPVKFQEKIVYLIDAIDILEEHFQSVSAALSTYLIQPTAIVFLSDLNNHFRIQMSVNRATPRALVLNYKFSDKNNDEYLQKAGHQLTLWLMGNNGNGYATYNVKLKKIRSYPQSGRKEYFLSHSWRKEAPNNITRRHKRVQFTQPGKIKLLSPPRPVESKTIPQQINVLIMDISLGGCSIVSNSKYEAFFERGQKVLVRCNNPLALRSGTYNNKDEEPFHQMVGHITRITSFIDQTHDGLCHIHVKFDKLQRRTKNSLGLFIYGLENVRIKNSKLSKN